jgi:uncharacterized oligopeptide transporter (OPT) family protein
MPTQAIEPTPRRRFLPAPGSPGYHILLSAVAIFILGPLGGISAAYMNFSLGFFVGGQVLAGILGSAVTYGYGAEGKHGANYMQTMAASVASLAGMGVLLQAMVWLGLPEPPAWQLVLYFMCIGMFGVGVGMLYTPVLVDRMQLTYPSGFAVANILRALTDPRLLRQSIRKLGGGGLAGLAGGWATLNLSLFARLGVAPDFLERLKHLDFSTSTLGAGMVVGARIAVPGVVVGLMGYYLTPYLRTIGWLGPEDPFRKIGFILALGTILGAAIVDIILIARQALQRLREKVAEPVKPADDWKRVNSYWLLGWVAAWGLGVILVGSRVLHQPVGFVALGVGLVFVFILVNGISLGISDWNPISSAFVVSVFIMAAAGLKDPGVGLMCAAILLIACAVGCDMQQDRSTGWRLGTNRRIQFRYQVIGIVMGAVLAVVLSRTFMHAYPVLQVDSFSNPNVEGAAQWQSAMTYKFVGALKGLTNPAPQLMQALAIGIGIGLGTEILRKLLRASPGYQRFVAGSRTGAVSGFVVDAIVLPSPYASSFGGFVNLVTTFWFAVGGVFGSVWEWRVQQRQAERAGANEVPADMSVSSLVGGGLIAGDSLAALSVGLYGLLRTLL